jgi:hypothetical protein
MAQKMHPSAYMKLRRGETPQRSSNNWHRDRGETGWRRERTFGCSCCCRDAFFYGLIFSIPFVKWRLTRNASASIVLVSLCICRTGFTTLSFCLNFGDKNAVPRLSLSTFSCLCYGNGDCPVFVCSGRGWAWWARPGWRPGWPRRTHGPWRRNDARNDGRRRNGRRRKSAMNSSWTRTRLPSSKQ